MLIDEENMTEDHLPLYSDEVRTVHPNTTIYFFNGE
jgi:hypothetical protein